MEETLYLQLLLLMAVAVVLVVVPTAQTVVAVVLLDTTVVAINMVVTVQLIKVIVAEIHAMLILTNLVVGVALALQALMQYLVQINQGEMELPRPLLEHQ
jgi:hypothetical protein